MRASTGKEDLSRMQFAKARWEATKGMTNDGALVVGNEVERLRDNMKEGKKCPNPEQEVVTEPGKVISKFLNEKKEEKEMKDEKPELKRFDEAWTSSELNAAMKETENSKNPLIRHKKPMES